MEISNSKILIHHHAVAYQEGETVWVQSFIATWVIALSQYFDQVGILLNTSPERLPKQDTAIQNQKVRLHPLGQVIKGRKVSKKEVIIKACQEAGATYDVLLIRGMTPQQLVVFKNCPTPQKAFLLVGSIKASKPKLKLHWLAFFLRYKYHERIGQIKQIAHSSSFFANSPHIVAELQERLNIKAGFMPTNTISIDDFIPFEHKEIQATPEILFCGRVVQDKGIEELIRAIGILKSKGKAIKLTIVGSVGTAYKKVLDRIAEEDGTSAQISYEGFVSFGAPLMSYYRRADLYVLPSWHEGFPHSIWEAAANCTPIITTKVGGIPGLMSEEEVYFIEMKNPISIANKVEFALDHIDTTALKVKTVYQKAKGFTVESCAEKIFTQLGTPTLVLNE